jgi:N-sulfoglucosamine sulfohydrolase
VIGYDEVVPIDSNRAEYVAPLTIEALRQAPTSEPWFMSVGFFETHRDFFAPTSVRDTLYSQPPANLPDVVTTRKDFAAFKASARSLDQGIGAVLHALHDFGLVENTLVLCTTDHGVAFPGAKATLFDRGIGVMMLMRGPGGFTGGKVIDAPISHLDVYPTLCELAGVEAPAWLQGSSLMPLVRGETERLHEAIFAETTYHAAYQPHRAVRTERWKYIRRFDDYEQPVLANCDDSASKELLVEAGWGEQIVPEEQLYDLILDPAEGANVAADPARGEVLAEMRTRLDAWMRETEDPLLDGPVAPPPGAIVNEQWQLSPDDPPRAVAADPTAAASS